ncbi:MAG: sigma-70 family RNA polymerase sigma factor [Armatimonadetes bacterium]|nr:sigma-70 family RNA polymerase sigma factor [Armatimonadota bacterium]MDE2206142.1 sigma-70 family RNA polymerase sigma factor [Armatimonadota bacterium]
MVSDAIQTIPIQVAAPADPQARSEERAWLDRCALGDRQAIDWVLHRYRDRIVHVAATVLRNPREAEDVAQEAFIKAFRQIGQFRAESGFYAWLYRIVVNLCLDKMRRKHVTAEVSLDAAPPALAASSPDLDKKILVQQLLNSLSPTIRAALLLRDVEGFDYAEIAVLLEIPVGTVRSRLNAARKQFRQRWLALQAEENRV